ncbi:hypothetical protein KKB_03812 [Kingella kingae PYKK081]|nr:hypothetical protein KKB_03812 [Kingella kingae PYKK081]QIF41284.1 hypothetical protein GB851_04170 [Kingella kingae]
MKLFFCLSDLLLQKDFFIEKRIKKQPALFALHENIYKSDSLRYITNRYIARWHIYTVIRRHTP